MSEESRLGREAIETVWLLKILFSLRSLMLLPREDSLLGHVHTALNRSNLAHIVRSRAALQLEILALRHQLHVLERSRPGRVPLRQSDRLLWVLLSRIWPGWRNAVVIVKPETVVGWHRQIFRRVWTWKSRRVGRPSVSSDVRVLIRSMSGANPLWVRRESTVNS
jgi:hypothetical protein